MNSIWMNTAQQVFLFLLTVVKLSLESNCPYDVSQSANNCLSPYRVQVNNMEMMKQTFYSGVDVETIRSICNALRNSFGCAQDVRKNCPDTEYNDIEIVLEDVISVAELCQRIPTPHHFLEVYARHQNCFTRLGAASEMCYQTFRIDGEPLQHELQRGRHTSTILLNYCSEFKTLVHCIKTNVDVTCGREAAGLVEYLVRPSVQFSEHCKNETLHTTTKVAVSKPTTSKPGQYGQTSSALSVTLSKTSTMPCTVLLVLIVSILSNAHLSA